MTIKIAAFIPVHGREPLLRLTVMRLTKQTMPIFKIVCVGETEAEERAVTESGGVFLKHKNNPLGEKWQAGIDYARKLGATDILIMGSSDWITDNWCELMSKEILNGYDLVGKSGIFFLDIGDKKRMAWWPGYLSPEKQRMMWWPNMDPNGPEAMDLWKKEYPDGMDRSQEPIGTGRLISNRILDKMNWQCFDHINESLDRSTYNRIMDAGGIILRADDAEAYPLSISCRFWKNKHIFEDEITHGVTLSDNEIEITLREWFPEAVDMDLSKVIK